ncbi:MAG: hypothetical protein WCK02_01990 [Bacteroidota bacterium]
MKTAKKDVAIIIKEIIMEFMVVLDNKQLLNSLKNIFNFSLDFCIQSLIIYACVYVYSPGLSILCFSICFGYCNDSQLAAFGGRS